MPAAGATWYGQFTLSSPVTGASAWADSPPSAVASHNGVADPFFTLAIAQSASVGLYNISGTIPLNYAIGDSVSISVSAVVGGLSGTAVIDTFTITSAPIVITPLAFDALSTVYCTDENIAARCGGDFPVLCPDWQQLCAGTDGVFQASDLWTLTSATVNFSAAGVRQGHVIQLQKPVSQYKGQGALLAVDSVASSSVTLRRMGQQLGIGQPPGPIGGLTSIQFQICSMDTQSEAIAWEINRRYNIDPNTPGRTPSDLTDLRDLRYCAVLWVLWQRYTAETREQTGDFALKAKQIKAELEEVWNRLSIRWAVSQTGTQKTTNWFTTRLVR